MGEPTIETLMDVMRDALAHLRAKAIAINLVAADLLKRGYYVYRILGMLSRENVISFLHTMQEVGV